MYLGNGSDLRRQLVKCTNLVAKSLTMLWYSLSLISPLQAPEFGVGSGETLNDDTEFDRDECRVDDRSVFRERGMVLDTVGVFSLLFLCQIRSGC